MNNPPEENENGKPDPQQLNIQCGPVPGEKSVVLSFGNVKLAWIKMGIRETRAIAIGLLNAAELAENPPPEQSPIQLPPGRPFPKV